MRIDVASLARWVRERYDRLLALLLLAGLLASAAHLAASLGRFDAKQRRFDADLEAMKPQHPRSEPPDVAMLNTARETLGRKTAVKWDKKTFVPELRRLCPNCPDPIPWDAAKCPFCQNEIRPVEPPPPDADKDGILDAWELKYGLNPRDPSDASKDADGDGFSNIEEFRYGTNPADASSVPPRWLKLYVKEVKAKPFRLMFMEWTRSSGPGGEVFQINDSRGQTVWKKIGDKVDEYDLVRFEEKYDQVGDGGVRRKKDVSILTLRKAQKLVELVRERRSADIDKDAVLFYQPEDRQIPVKEDAEFTLGDQKYSVKKIDMEHRRVLVIHAVSGEEKWVELWRAVPEAKATATDASGQGEAGG